MRRKIAWFIIECVVIPALRFTRWLDREHTKIEITKTKDGK